MAALVALTLVKGDQQIFGVEGKSVLCVPKSDLDPVLLPLADESIDLHVGSGHSPGFAFLFGSRFMRSIISGYRIVAGFEDHPYANTLSGTIGFLAPDDQARLGSAMRARNTSDEWYSRDECPQPSVRPLGDNRLYEVKCSPKASYSSIWRQAPDPKVAMPNPNELVVATCQNDDIHLGPYAGKSLTTCARVVIIDGFLVDYRLQEKNLGFFLEIDSIIRDKLSEWKGNCSI